MTRVKFELNRAGVRELLQSAEAQALVREYASKRAQGLGAGYEVETFIGFDRAHAAIKAADPEAMRDNLNNNTLLKALGG